MSSSPSQSRKPARPRVRKPTQGYYAAKAAAVAAYILLKTTPRMSKMKLAKMLYLVERKFAELHGYPLFMDRYVAIKHGPIPSTALSGIDGEADEEIWSTHVVLRDPRTVELAPEITLEALGELSDNDCDVTDQVIAQFGGMTATQIRNWTHTHLPEYREKEPALAKGAASVEITPVDMARGFGHKDLPAFEKIVRARKRYGGP